MLSDTLDHTLRATLADWEQREWLRPLDRAVAALLASRVATDPRVVLCAALASRETGEGHICLPLAQLFQPTVSPDAATWGVSDVPSLTALLLASPLVSGGEGDAPLVLQGGRLYLRRYWQAEQRCAWHLHQRMRDRIPPPTLDRHWLDALFQPLRDAQEQRGETPHWQTLAAALATRSRFTVITGGPGTGKTTAVVCILALLQRLQADPPLTIQLAAPTGKAAARLGGSIASASVRLPALQGITLPSQATTLHRLLGADPGQRTFRHDRHRPLEVDVLVVDEASMIDIELMSALLDALPASARLILLGDKDQLASVEAGAVMAELCRNAETVQWDADTQAWLKASTGYAPEARTTENPGMGNHTVMLRTSRRFSAGSGIGRLAREVRDGRWPDNNDPVWQAGDLVQLPISGTQGQTFAEVVRGERGAPGYAGALREATRHLTVNDNLEAHALSVLDALDDCRFLTPLKQGPWGVSGLNDRIESILADAGLVRPFSNPWYVGRPVLVTRNDVALGVMNGDIGITLEDPREHCLRVFFRQADGSIKGVLPSRLPPVVTAYAMTVHKSQGSEFRHTVLIIPPDPARRLTRELLYTGITRAREWLTLIGPALGTLPDAAHRRVQRASSLGDLLEGHLPLHARAAP